MVQLKSYAQLKREAARLSFNSCMVQLKSRAEAALPKDQPEF